MEIFKAFIKRFEETRDERFNIEVKTLIFSFPNYFRVRPMVYSSRCFNYFHNTRLKETFINFEEFKHMNCQGFEFDDLLRVINFQRPT
jgi:hypothetical protein